MKLYMFYFKGDNTSETGYSLYAFTDDKEMYKIFKKTRNMEAFRIQIQNVSKEDLIEFKNNHHDDELRMYNFDKFNKNTWKYENVKFLTTYYEQCMVKDISDSFYAMDFEDLGVSQTNGNMGMFMLEIKHLDMLKLKYKDILNALYYLQMHEISLGRPYSILPEDYAYKNQFTYNFSVDEVSVFIELFKYTLKISEGRDINEQDIENS